MDCGGDAPLSQFDREVSTSNDCLCPLFNDAFVSERDLKKKKTENIFKIP